MALLNQGVGGHIFDPLSLDRDIPLHPDLITVAYGTNDWGRCGSLADFRGPMENYLHELRDIFPEATIFVITPIWRRDMGEAKPAGGFIEIGKSIRDVCSRLPSVHVVDGLELVPHFSSFFGDGRVHPTDEGFLHYSLNLLGRIRQSFP
jgi:hypothetical protein